MASEEEISLLVMVLDVNPIWWGQQAQREPQFTLSKCMDAVMVMANAHVAMSRNNKLAVIASHCKDSHFLYPTTSETGNDGTTDDVCSSGDGKYELLSVANNIIADQIRNLMSNIEVTGGSTDTLLAGSLAKALCYINRISKELEVGQEVKSRILVIKAADDCALQYMNFMNVIFAAQKQSILIDACVLESDSGLLQQACDITGGLYLKIPQKAALAQYLLWVFLPDGEQRLQLLLPPPVHVDYRAACFCHRNLIQIGYVCSVCLSIFCNFSPICTTCETAFKIQLPQMVKGKKKKLKAS
ncbi:general transcription factor IIH subunit 3 isoform X2 [Corythoichthys intestinalis]|uniref:general transcription factor IIH subunit 3 isoform X2 n=1 Tax=Corythoichthys intestinalis TaxID=161448 RepID=UPI0025A67BB9|nr:general transcription factor IIH subunit 3 isoform X2 [Corythoichthys intestinalis]